MVADHFAQDFADQTEADFDEVRKEVMIQSIIGKTLSVKYFDAYEDLDGGSKSSIISDADSVVE